MSKGFHASSGKLPAGRGNAWANVMTAANGVIGCGVGLLLAGKLGRPAQRITAAALLAVGAVATVPFVYGVLAKQINRAESERGVKQRLASIRGGEGGGFEGETEVY